MGYKGNFWTLWETSSEDKRDFESLEHLERLWDGREIWGNLWETGETWKIWRNCSGRESWVTRMLVSISCPRASQGFKETEMRGEVTRAHYDIFTAFVAVRLPSFPSWCVSVCLFVCYLFPFLSLSIFFFPSSFCLTSRHTMSFVWVSCVTLCPSLPVSLFHLHGSLWSIYDSTLRYKFELYPPCIFTSFSFDR